MIEIWHYLADFIALGISLGDIAYLCSFVNSFCYGQYSSGFACQAFYASQISIEDRLVFGYLLLFS